MTPYRDRYPDFLRALEAKLERGARDYGDASLSLDPERYLGELAAEALDLAGWGYLLWRRCEELREALVPRPRAIGWGELGQPVYGRRGEAPVDRVAERGRE